MKPSAAGVALALVLITVASGIPTSAMAVYNDAQLSVDPPLLKWQVQEWSFAGDPVLSPNGTTYVLVGSQGDPSSTNNPTMRAYSSDGPLLWSRQMVGRANILQPEADGHLFVLETESKAVGNQLIHVSRLISLDDMGMTEWTWGMEVASDEVSVQEACIFDGRAYLVATSWSHPDLPSRVYALERNGSLRWTVDIAATLATISYQPRLGGFLLTAPYFHMLRTAPISAFLIQENGSYESFLTIEGYSITNGPIIDQDGVIYAAVGPYGHEDSPTEIRAYGPDGILRWRFMLPFNQTEVAPMAIRQLICLEGGRLAIIGYGGEWLNNGQRLAPSIICLEGNGTMRWRTEIGYPYSDAVLYADRLYVCAEHELLEMDLEGQVTRRYTAMWLADIHGLAIGSDGSFRFLEISNSGKSTLYATGGFPQNSLLDAIINNFFQLVAAVLGVVLTLYVFRRHVRGWY